MAISDENLMTSTVEHFRKHYSLGPQLNLTVCSEIRVCRAKNSKTHHQIELELLCNTSELHSREKF